MVRLCAAPRASARRANISGQHELPSRRGAVFISSRTLLTVFLRRFLVRSWMVYLFFFWYVPAVYYTPQGGAW